MSGLSAEGDAKARSGDQSTEPLRYPRNQLVAVIDTEEQLADATRALRQAGFSDSEVTAVSGIAAADRLKANSGRTGLAGLAVRIADRLGLQDEEMELKSRYEAAMRDGRFLLAVSAPATERKERAVEILKEHGAHGIHFHGRFTIEGSPISDEP